MAVIDSASCSSERTRKLDHASRVLHHIFGLQNGSSFGVFSPTETSKVILSIILPWFDIIKKLKGKKLALWNVTSKSYDSLSLYSSYGPCYVIGIQVMRVILVDDESAMKSHEQSSCLYSTKLNKILSFSYLYLINLI
jgi:hypothetical protein